MSDKTNSKIQGKRAKCQYNYKATMTDELNIKVDDIIVLIQCSEDETWLEGTLNGVTGWFPSNYVQILEDNENITQTDTNSFENEHKKQEYEDELLRNKYIHEVKKTEEDFLDEMCKFVKIAIQPLKANEEIFSGVFVQNLSSCLDDVIRSHQNFYQQLKEIPENLNGKIGNLFINFAPQFKLVYENYARMNPKFTGMINNKKEELSRHFESSLAKMSSPLLPTTSTITVAIYFTKFLAAPFKQLETYIKILKEIQRYTQDSHVDRGDVQRSIEFFSELTNNVLEIRKMKEYELDLMSSKINGLEDDLFKNGESLYICQAVVVSDNGDIKERILIIFSNYMIILAPTSNPNEFDYEYKIQFFNQNMNSVGQIRKVSNVDTIKNSYGSVNLSSSIFINKYCFELIDVVIHNRSNSIHIGKFLIICSSLYDLKNSFDLISNAISKIQFSLNNKNLSTLRKNLSINSVNKPKGVIEGSKKSDSPIQPNLANKIKNKKMFYLRPHAPLIPHFQLPSDASVPNQDQNSTIKRFMYKKPKSSDIGKYHGADDDLKLLNVIDSLSKIKTRTVNTNTTTVNTTTSTNANNSFGQETKHAACSNLNKSNNSVKANDSLNDSLTTSTMNEKGLYKYINRLTEEKIRLESNLSSVSNELNEFKKSNKELKTILGSMQKQLENERQTRRKLENFIRKHFKPNQQIISNQNEQSSFLMSLDHESAI